MSNNKSNVVEFKTNRTNIQRTSAKETTIKERTKKRIFKDYSVTLQFESINTHIVATNCYYGCKWVRSGMVGAELKHMQLHRQQPISIISINC